MKIPNASNAVVDIRKLRAYCLNHEHRLGKHKARLFDSQLGLTVDDAEVLQSWLLSIVKSENAELGDKDSHGQRYQIMAIMQWAGKSATILSAWIVRPAEGFPDLITCYPI